MRCPSLKKSEDMIPREILRKVRRIEITTKRMVSDFFAGEYESVFKGRGMEFDEVREYQPGDDIRSIDWNVTARTGQPHVKKFVEERELTVMFLVDASASGQFGTVNKMKSELAAEICAVLAFSAIRNKDKVGLIIFTDVVEKFVPPKKGNIHVLRVIRELLYFRPTGTGTDISVALEYLNRVTTRRAVTFLVSDFLAEGYDKALRIANKKHDIIAIDISDPREMELPSIGYLQLTDAETGESMVVDTRDGNLRRELKSLKESETRERKRIFNAVGVDYIGISTDEPYVEPLMKFFKMRARRR